MKRVIIFLLLLYQTIFISYSSAQSLPITNGLNYLTSTQNPDGSWGDDTSNTEILPATVSVIETLQILNQTGTSNYNNAISWLQGQTLETTDYLSERIHALSVAGTDRDLLLSYIDEIYTGAWGGYDDFEVNNLDTLLALQSLKKINYSDQTVISNAISYLLSTQNPDGGFGFYAGDESNVYMTALVLSTLSQFKSIYNLQSSISNAVAYLLTKQNPDGGFGDSESTIYETALAFMSLVESGLLGVTSPTVLQNAINYLNSTQLSNGSWDDDPYSTALALRALANVKPNLTISSSDITFSNSTPTVGDTITITANIKNTGPAQADNVLVQFFDGDPDSGGLLIGESTITSISAYSSSSANISWTIPTASSKIIFIKMDPSNSIDELNETDNIASKNLTSATLPDLSVFSPDILFNPIYPQAGGMVTIFVIVRNKGETPASNVAVDIYNGDPVNGGVIIGSSNIPVVNPGDSVQVKLQQSFPAGNYGIYAVLDKNNFVNEGSEDNNTALKNLHVGEIVGNDIDLSIGFTDISFTPEYPVDGNIVTINGTIHNIGQAEANNILVQFYLGDPDLGGTLIGSNTIIGPIARGSSTSVSTAWNTTGHTGSNDIYIIVDPLDGIIESDEFNNKAFRTLKVAAKTGTNLMVSNSEITFTPSSLVSGDNVTISAVIRNNSLVKANNVLVEFSDGNPRVSGTRIIGRQVIPSISGGVWGSVTIQISWDTSGLSGTHEIYVNVDPLNEISEVDEKDNIAYAKIEIMQPQKPDITVSAIDTTNLITDTKSLQVSGSVRVTIENKGNQSTNNAFEITAFEDSNNNRTLDIDSDNILGKVIYINNLIGSGTDTIDIPVSGNILFKDNLIYVMADSGNTIDELDETNNIRHTGKQCENNPTCRKWDVVEKFAWTGSKIFPTLKDVYNVPLVANITDDNGDGLIDEKDIPDIIFHTNSIRAISGDDGHELFTVTNPNYFIWQYTHLAVGDIDNNGIVEILGFSMRWAPVVIAFNHDGTLKWISDPIAIPTGYFEKWGVSIADIDGDGKPEIISGPNVLNNDGTLRWSVPVYDGLPVIADLDLDGFPEIIIGNTAYRNDGTIYWTNTTIKTANVGHAIANLDDDPYPEIIQVTGSLQYNVLVYAFEHDGALKWGPVKINSGGYPSAPSIGDFDGDGKPEIGISAGHRYTVLRANGSILWESVVYDGTAGGLSAAVFDFDNDGTPEIVYNDMQYLRIYNGKDGTILFSTPNSTATVYDYVIVADVDNDGSAEIVANANSGYTYNYRGIRVFENRCDAWSNTRKIWNEYNYHITNVNDDGTIPKVEQNNWEIYNNYRQNPVLPGNAWSKSDISASYITIDQTNYPSSVTISARIGNGGTVSQIAGVDIAFYDGDPNQGGVLIGTAKTMRVLDAGGYEDVSVIWSNPTSGNHNIFVVADKDNKFNECREDNNIASASFDLGGIQPPVQNLPDLSISSSDITIIPPDTIEGQPAVIKAIINNIGTLGASDVAVSFYDGDPLSGGILIGSVTKSYIDQGATALAEVTWDTFGQSGRNYIHVKVDPQNLIEESNENNNEAIIFVDITPPSRPDLAITSSDITFSNLNPKEGDPLTINATIHNLGLDTGDIEVFLYNGDPSSGGVLLSQKTISQIIPFGGKVTLSFDLNTIGLSGIHNFYISLDPNNIIDEITETNNIAWNSLTIGQSGLSLGISTDKTVYTANEDVQIAVNIGNLISSERTGTLEVKVLDLSNNVVSTVSSQALTLSPNENKVLNYTWNTGQTFAGDYKVYSHFIEGGNIVAKADTPITISPVKTISSKITTDKISYKANETVTIASTIQSLSPNYIFENLVANISIQYTVNSTQVYTETKTIPILTIGQLTELKTYWNTSTNPKGIYTVTLKVFEGITILSTSTATFEILGSSDTGEGLRGTISASPNPVYQGKNETVTYTVTNIGNEDIANLNVKVLIVNPDTQEIKNTFEGTINLPMNTTATGNFISSTTNLSPRIYLAILQARSLTMPEYKTLASTTFEVKPGIEISKTIPDVKNILVWLNYSCIIDSSQNTVDSSQENNCVNQTLIEQALSEAGVNYHIVLDKKDFETELRNPYYTDFIILGEHNPIEDHFSEELREQVYSGKGLISSMFNRQNLDSEVFGIKFNGHLSGRDYPIELLESEISNTGTFQSSGRALKVDALNPSDVIAWIVETPKYPGIIKRQYGKGNVLFYAFDLGMSSENYNQFENLLKNSLNYIHTPLDTTAFHPDQLVPVEIKIKSLGGAFDLRIKETYPSDLKLYDPFTGQWITENPWIINTHLEPNETKIILYYLLTPDRAGTYTLKTEVGYMENETYNFYQNISTDIVINKNTASMTADIITALKAISISGQEKAKVDNAIKYIENVRTRTIVTENDIEANISDILKAIESLLSVTSADISNVRLMIDELLMVWESRYYLGLI